MSKLTMKQKLFCQNYIATKGNGSLSATLAGYSCKGTSPAVIASGLLRNVNVQEELRRLIEEAESDVAPVEEVLKTLTEILRGKATDTTVVNIGLGRGITKAEKVQVPAPTSERRQAASTLLKYYSASTSKESQTPTTIKIVRKEKK